MAIAVRCVVRAPPKTSLVVRRAGAAQDESGGGRISVTEGIMAHAMTYYAAISACSMGGICMHPSDAVAYFYFQISDQCCEEGGK